MYLVFPKGGSKRQYTYVHLVETYRRQDGKQRQRIIKNFGRLDKLLIEDPHALDKIRAQFQTDKDAKYQAEAKQLVGELNSYLSSLAGSPDRKLVLCALVYGQYALKAIWNSLGLDAKLSHLQDYFFKKLGYSFKDALFYMVAMKALFPRSISSSWESRIQFLGDPVGATKLKDLYDCYEKLYWWQGKIGEWINRKLDADFGKERTAVIFYDVTNSYFETPLTDAEKGYRRKDYANDVYELAVECLSAGLISEDCFDEDANLIAEKLPDSFMELVESKKIEFLRMRGPSKEKRSDLPLVSIALIMDRNGIPMAIKVYSGNASEFKTMKQSIESLKKQYSVERAIIVADRGLNSKENLSMLSDMGLWFLMAQKITDLNADLTKELLDLDTYKPIDPNHPEYGKYKEVKDWKRKICKGKEVVCNLVFTFTETRKKRDDAVIDSWIAIVNKKAKNKEKLGKRKVGWPSIAKTDTAAEGVVTGVDQDALARKRSFCGFAAVVYDANEGDFADVLGLSPEEAISKPGAAQATKAYHKLVQIEDCFRCMKDYFGLRPMWVWNSRHIESHVYICFLALLIVRLLQKKLEAAGVKMSLENILETLRQAKVIATPPGEKSGPTFLAVDMNPLPMEANPWMSRKEIAELMDQCGDRSSSIGKIMEAVGLSEPPMVARLGHLEDALKTKFSGLDDAVPYEWVHCWELQNCTLSDSHC